MELQTGQISSDRNVNYGYATAAFTVSPESRALSCCADLPGDLSLVCCFCSSAHSFALRLPSDGLSRFRPCLRLVLVSMYKPLTGFTYRGLSPHKFTPMPGVPKNFSGRPKSGPPLSLTYGRAARARTASCAFALARLVRPRADSRGRTNRSSANPIGLVMQA